MLAGTVVAVVASIALALPSLRVSGDYLLIASIGFQLGVLEVIKNLRFTGGPGGFTNIPPFLIREFGRESYVAAGAGRDGRRDPAGAVDQRAATTAAP